MSDIAKCPLCGLEMSMYIYRQREVISCDSEDCSFRCNNADLPIVAAAMELANAEAKMTKAIEDCAAFDCARIDLFEAKRRVLEVFK